MKEAAVAVLSPDIGAPTGVARNGPSRPTDSSLASPHSCRAGRPAARRPGIAQATGLSLESKAADLVGQGLVKEAATLVIQVLGPEILGYLRAVLRDEDRAGDAFSKFAEGVWRGLVGFRGDSSLRVWCYRIAWNKVAEQRRDPYLLRRERFATSMISRVAGNVFATTAAEVERRSDALQRLRAQLEPEEQTLLTLRVDRKLTWREVAEVLAVEGAPVDEAALRKRFERLKGNLARAAREAGLFR